MEDKTAPKAKRKVINMAPTPAEEAQGIMEVPMAEKQEVIEPYQLRKLQEFNVSLGQAREALGEISLTYELQKDEILNRVKVFRAKMSELEKEITDRHGKNITIDINTGVINRTDVQG